MGTKIIFSVLAVLFVALGVYYFLTPAGSLPHFLPGYTAGSQSPHIKHGIACLVLAVGSGLLVWFAGGKPSNESAAEPKI